MALDGTPGPGTSVSVRVSVSVLRCQSTDVNFVS